MVAAGAMARSTPVPPCPRTRRPVWVARVWGVATIPRRAMLTGHPVRMCSLCLLRRHPAADPGEEGEEGGEEEEDERRHHEAGGDRPREEDQEGAVGEDQALPERLLRDVPQHHGRGLHPSPDPAVRRLPARRRDGYGSS